MAIENIGLYPITIDVYKKHKESTVYANDNDMNGRGLLINLVKNNASFDSTGITLKIGFRNAVGEERLYDCDIVDVLTGQYKVFYPTEMLVGNGGRVVKLEIKAYESTGALLNYAPIFVYVNASEIPDEATEATNEGSALFKALTEYEAIGEEYLIAEGMRDADYDTAELSRNTLYNSSEQTRNTSYNTAETNRNTLYGTEEGIRNTQYASSETDRDGLYTTAETNRDNLYTTAEANRSTLVNSINAQLAEIETDVDKSNLFIDGLPPFVLTAQYGTIDGTGIVSTAVTTKSNIVTRKIMRTEFDTLKIIANVGYQVNYCLYDGDTFISRNSWSSGVSQMTFNLNNNYDVMIIAGKYIAGDVVPVEDMLANAFTASTTKAIAFKTLSELSNEVNGIEYLSRIKSCEFDGKIIHFSFDDIYDSLNQLITSPPTSIYDVPFFNDLKTLHETYGAVFTLNCFNKQSTVPAYDISNLPSTWQAEFQAAKNWMKFAYHGENEVADYNSTVGIEASYAKFVAAIYNLTGDYACIDTVTRLGFYGGSLANIELIKDNGANKGITGLLSADDVRTSYYLTQDQENILIKNGKYFDVANKMYFVRSMPRVDNNTDAQVIATIEANLKYEKYTEIFVHESSWLSTTGYKTRYQNILTWANANGYKHRYLMDIFNTQ